MTDKQSIFMFKHYKNIVPFVLAVSLSLLFGAVGCNKTNKYLRVTQSQFEFEAAPQLEIVTVESSSEWMPYYSESWIEAFRESDKIHIIIAESNESLSARESKIEVINGDAQRVVISILQKAIDAGFTVTPKRLDFSGKGETKTIAVEAKNIRKWGASSRNAWLAVAEGVFEQDETLSITAAPSTLFVPRKDTIEIGSAITGLEVALKIPVEQSGVNLVVSHEELVNNTIMTGAEPRTIELGIMCVYDWTLSTNLTTNTSRGPADEIGSPITILIQAHTGTEPITHTLTFTCGGENYDVYIIQSNTI